MSSPTTTSFQSFRSLDCVPTKKQSNAQFKRAIFSSLRVKKGAERPSVIGNLSESRWSLYSVNSACTDDFNWSLQPNYLKMMNDTNLMDSCAAAKEEIESNRERESMRQLQFLETNKLERQRSTVDPDQLLQWIVYMEKYLDAFSPNWQQVREMNENERNISFNEQCELRQYIASNNRIFNQMIKEQGDSPLTRNVQDKYHMLLLNAIEKQCLLEGYPKVEDKRKCIDYPDVNLDMYKLCSIDTEPQDYTLVRSTESLSSNSDTDTIITSDDGINFPTHPTTSKSSLFSEDHCSPFSSHLDVQHKEHQSWENIMKELDNIIDVDSNVQSSSSNDLAKNRKSSSSSISECTLRLIENVDSVLPRAATPNIDAYLNPTNKVDDWLINNPSASSESRNKSVADVERKMGKIIGSLSSGSDRGSTVSIQWDNFQDIYSLTVPIHEEPNNDFLYFGDDYDDALKCIRGSSSSISDMVKSTSTSTPTTPSKSEKSSPKYQNGEDKTIVPSTGNKNVSRKKKRVSRTLNKKSDPVLQQQSIPNDRSVMARDILLIVENLRCNYMNLKPQDFDGILKICKENLGCLIVVLDKDQRSHCRSNESLKSVGDDKIYIQESCQCGIIGKFVACIVRFLYDCSRNVRRSAICRFLLKFLKKMYALVKFFSQQVRVYRSYYDNY